MANHHCFGGQQKNSVYRGFDTFRMLLIMSMKESLKRNISHIHIETNNILAFEIQGEQDEVELEAEGITVAVQQINLLYAELNREFEDGSQPRTSQEAAK